MKVLKMSRIQVFGSFWLLVLGALLMAQLAGCGASNPYPTGTYERANFYVENGKNIEAVAALETFVRKNPTDSLAAEAQYQKALLYIDMKEYPLAAVEFQILRKDYPISNRVEDSFFYEGVAYYRQVGKVQRDVTGAHEARLHFLEFSQKYPGSEHMPQIVQYMQEISDLMVQKRLQQAKVFWQLKRYAAIEVTLETALKDEASSSLLDKVMWRRGLAAVKLKNWDTAKDMYQRLVSEYPESPLVKKAQNALVRLEKSMAEEIATEDPEN